MHSQIVLTCEHGGNKIPAQYLKFFRTKSKRALISHRGWDIGALNVAKRLARVLNVPLFFSQTSRLLIDLNRSIGKKNLFSEFSSLIPVKGRIIADFYSPYRQQVKAHIVECLNSHDRVCHFSIHSFTSVLNGEVRNCEIGLLYDPSKTSERTLCRKLQTLLKAEFPNLRIRLNYPYKGIGDGFPTHLRKIHNHSRYSGVEVELNQNWLIENRERNFETRFAKIILQACTS